MCGRKRCRDLCADIRYDPYDAPYFIILLCLMPDYFTLSNARPFHPV